MPPIIISGEMAATSGTDVRISSTSETSRRILRPARSPPAWLEVRPPSSSTRSCPTVMNARRKAMWKPLP
jgi:hypothetical protein